MRIDPRRYFEFLFLLMLAMCLTFLCLRNIGDRRAGQFYREAERLADIPHVAEPFPALLEVSVPDAGTVPDADSEDEPKGIDLSPLQEVNADVVGWIEIPGILSYPLFQCGDNAYYLTHAWNGEENAAGAVFLDWRADAGMGGFNTLIYEHRMRNEAMFGCLKHYKDADFWWENLTVIIANEGGTWQYDIYAAYEAGLTADTYWQEFSSPEEKQGFIQYGLDRSVIDTGITPTSEDRIITLSTCSGSSRNTRWVVQAVCHQRIRGGLF